MCEFESHQPTYVLKRFSNPPQFVPILLVVSTNSLLVLDQRTLQVKYRIPAHDIQRISLSPFLGELPFLTLLEFPRMNRKAEILMYLLWELHSYGVMVQWYC